MKIPARMANNISFMLDQTAKASQRYLDQQMTALGLTRSQWLLLSVLYFVNGSNQKDLADILDVGKGAVGKLAHKLEQKGWLCRVADTQDARAFNLYISQRATPMVKKLVELLMEDTARSLTGIRNDELAVMRTTLRRIKNNVEAVPVSRKWKRLKTELEAEIRRFNTF